jgi:hypothetical protein
MSREPSGNLVIENRTVRFESSSERAFLVIQIHHIVELVRCVLKPARPRGGFLPLLGIGFAILAIVGGTLMVLCEAPGPDLPREFERVLRQNQPALRAAIAVSIAAVGVIVVFKVARGVVSGIIGLFRGRTYGLVLRTSLGEQLVLSSKDEGDVREIYDQLVRRMDAEGTTKVFQRFVKHVHGDQVFGDKTVTRGNVMTVGDGAVVNGTSQSYGR